MHDDMHLMHSSIGHWKQALRLVHDHAYALQACRRRALNSEGIEPLKSLPHGSVCASTPCQQSCW
eukprot:1159869-Pelagomonas_calceolata.AAC.10